MPVARREEPSSALQAPFPVRRGLERVPRGLVGPATVADDRELFRGSRRAPDPV